MTVLKIIKIFLLVLYAVCESCEAYHRYGNIKSDQHKNSLWNNKLYNANSASSTSSSSWYRNNHQHGGTTTTTAMPHHIRHGGYSSRYPKLDGVMHRLNPPRKPKPTENTSFHGKKANDHRWDSYYEENDYNEDDVLETIDGKEEDIAEDDHKWNDDDTYDNDYSEDDDDYFDVDDTDEIQAEEATDAPTSSLTDYKWEHFGSRDRVEKSRNMQMQQLKNTVENPADAAVSHYLKVQAAGKCRVPIPKVLPVHSEHPSHGKTYIPHCTILHRCSEDSGCCQNQGTKCGPKSQTIVELYFYAHSRGTTHVEKLSFYNHTECACIDINELAALNNNAADIISTVSKKTISLKSALPAENLIRCKCPSQFIPNPRYTSYCSCTCSNDNIDCERMQRGMEYLSLKDRICIKSGQCSFPTCEYGKYLKDVGRCPKKLEKQEAHTNSNSN